MSRDARWASICHDAVSMSADDGQALEEKLRDAPDDVEARVQLAGHYFLAPSDDAQHRRALHLHWLIANRPDIDVGGYGVLSRERGPADYDEAARLWKASVEKQPEDIRVLRNAARFFSISGNEEAEAVLRRASALEPESAEWHKELARLREKAARYAPPEVERIRFGRETLAEIDAALALEKDALRRAILLVDLSTAALLAGELTRASEAAERALADAPAFESTWWFGNAIHRGHIVLGHVALARDDVAGAVRHLAAAGATRGSPQLNSFGPDFELAKELFARGERDAVVAYLDACKQFWMYGHIVDRWKSAIERGAQPSFEKNEVVDE